MVRRNELACRDEWTRTLWEEGSFGGGYASPAQPVDPATEVEIAALVRTDLAGDESSAADVVLGEARLVSDATPPWRLPSSGLAAPVVPVPPAAGFDSRTAILRAREAYRERVKAAERERPAPVPVANADAAPDLLVAQAAEAAEATLDSAAVADLSGYEPMAVPVAEGEWLAELDDEEADLAARFAEWSDETGAAAGIDLEGERIGWDDGSSLDPGFGAAIAQEEPPARVAAAEPAAEPEAPRRWEAIPVEPLAPNDDWTPVQPEWQADAPGAGGTDWSPVGVQAPEDDLWEPAPVAASAAAHPQPDADGGWQGTPVWDEAWIAELARESARGEHWAEWDLATEDDEPEDRPFEPVAADDQAIAPVAVDIVLDPAPFASARIALAPNVPRVCRTCRDFRPAEGGDRGWCANQWAFTHRRLVDPEEAAPCESSIGSWWLPADELYIGDADISAHGLSTPLLDRWLPGHVAAEPERKQS